MPARGPVPTLQELIVALGSRQAGGTSRYTAAVSPLEPDRAEEASPTGLDADTRELTAAWQPLGEVRVPGLTVLYHPELQRIGERVALTTLAAGQETLLSRLEPYFYRPGVVGSHPLADPYLSRTPLRLAPRPGGGLVVSGDPKVRLRCEGAVFTGFFELDAAALERGAVLELGERVVLCVGLVDPLPAPGLVRYDLIGESAGFERGLREIHQVARTAVPVLLRGETGSGKELVAQAIHKASERARGPFVAVNLAAVPPTLAASELFGSVKGAYTGADRSREGFFARANGGTLFLDEIGEAGIELQAHLLRALETGEIQPVGADQSRRVDVRLIAATDAPLERAIAAGCFRAPLFYRLASYELRLPPLRERRDDIGRLLLHFLREELEAMGKKSLLEPSPGEPHWLPAPLVARLARLDWPGNVRQLRNVVRQLVIGNVHAPQARWLPILDGLAESPAERESGSRASLANGASGAEPKRYRAPAEVGDEELIEALRAHNFRVKPTAVALGVSRTALYGLIERSRRLRKAADLDPAEIAHAAAAAGSEIEVLAAALEVSPEGLLIRLKELGLR
jgi:two-component system nitrogen regulation response regulator GlnG